MDLLIPLFDSEQKLVEILLQQLEKMVSTKEALKHMEDRVKKRKMANPSFVLAASPLSSPSGCGEKKEGSRARFKVDKGAAEEDERSSNY